MREQSGAHSMPAQDYSSWRSEFGAAVDARHQERYDDAAAHLFRATRKARRSGRRLIYRELTLLLGRMGRAHEAEEIASMLVATSGSLPDLAAALATLGMAQLEMYRLGDAEVSFRLARRLPIAERYRLLAESSLLRIYAITGQHERARRFRISLKYLPKPFQLWSLGSLAMGRGEHREAARLLRQAWGEMPPSAARMRALIGIELAAAYSAAGDRHKSKEILGRIVFALGRLRHTDEVAARTWSLIVSTEMDPGDILKDVRKFSRAGRPQGDLPDHLPSPSS